MNEDKQQARKHQEAETIRLLLVRDGNGALALHGSTCAAMHGPNHARIQRPAQAPPATLS